VPATTILIRHADVTPGGGNDPPLNDAGVARAQELRHVLADARISAIFVSPRQRTQATAAPLAADLGIAPAVVADAASAVAAIRKLPATAVVLVIGHTTTLPDISAGLGGPTIPGIDLSEFDHLFVQARRRLAHLHYGAKHS
jgi:phosphohistidine phosphatase SixA